MIGLCSGKSLINCECTIAFVVTIVVYSCKCSLSLDDFLMNYNLLYNKAITPELKTVFLKKLPSKAKFFDELNCK